MKFVGRTVCETSDVQANVDKSKCDRVCLLVWWPIMSLSGTSNTP